VRRATRNPARRLRGFSAPAQHGKNVLDVRRLEKPQPAVLHEGNAAPHELDLERRAVARAAKQHGLRFERDAALGVREHGLGNAPRLIGIVANGDEPRSPAARTLAPQRLAESLGRERDDRVGRVEDAPCRAVIALERDDAGGRIEVRGKVEDVAHGGGAKRVDRLRVVADHGHAIARRLEAEEDARLERVGVLVFVDEHVVEARADVRRERRVAHHVRPVEQQVVVVEHVLRLLLLHVGFEEPAQLGLERRAPREGVREHVAERHHAVHHARVDREARRLAREAPLGVGQSACVPHEREEVLRVAAVLNGECLGHADARRVLAQQARADTVERARPR